MTDAPNWKIPSTPTDAPVPSSPSLEDNLMNSLAEVNFATEPEPDPSPRAATPPQPVHAIDPDYQTIHAALQAGTIPTFADQSTAIPTALPLDPASEREAYIAFLQFIQQHKDPNTSVSFVDPDEFAAGLI